jgi:hypothetical protein
VLKIIILGMTKLILFYTGIGKLKLKLGFYR